MTLTGTAPYRQPIRLADGRELIYYDREPGRDRSTPDQRVGLPVANLSSQVRWDPLFEEHAEQWGQLLHGGDAITVETRIPKSLADQLFLREANSTG